jgi:molybdopterin-guanine dinucleotide biosynthesis protein A
MDIEAVLLTGGASKRMGEDKASLPVGGIPVARRTAEVLAEACQKVTILGPEPILGFPCIKDEEPGEGPLAALALFGPVSQYVFVCSCDIPYFDARLVIQAQEAIGESNAAVPLVDGRRQPLCALYSNDAFPILRATAAEGKRSIMAWLDRLAVAEFLPEKVIWGRGANTPEEWRALG